MMSGLPTWRKYKWDAHILAEQGSDLVDCASCPLATDGKCRGASQMVPDHVPEGESRLLIVLDWPTKEEVYHKSPFGGKTGQLLKNVCNEEGLPIEDAYITYAHACRKPRDLVLSKEDGPLITKACRKRILTLAHHYRPRVVLAFGQEALDVFAGEVIQKEKRVPFDCPTEPIPETALLRKSCDGQGKRTWKAWSCTKCKKVFPTTQVPFVDKDTVPEGTPCAVECGYTEAKPLTTQGKWRPRNQKCGTCDGKKTRAELVELFQQNHKLTGQKGVAGGRIESSSLPTAEWFQDEFQLLAIHPFRQLYKTPNTKAQKFTMGQWLFPAMSLHLGKAARYLYTDPVWDLSYETFYADDVEKFEAWLVDNPGPYSNDLETNAANPTDVTTIKCAGIDSFTTGKTCVLVTHGLSANAPIVQAYLRYLGNPEYKKVWQNGFGYDVPVLDQVWGFRDQHGYIGDTLTRHSILRPDEQHTLAHISFSFSDQPVWKPHVNVANMEVGEELWEYNAMDLRATTLSYKAMEAELYKQNQLLVDRITQRKVELAVHMGQAGLPIDRKAQLEVGAASQHELEQALNRMRTFVQSRGGLPGDLLPEKREADGALFNPNSSKQLLWVLFDPTGLLKLTPTKLSEKTKEPSTSEEALIPYKDLPFIQDLFMYRAHSKTKSTYVDGMVPGPDGRLRMVWKPTGARTGRYSTSPNAQNWSKLTKSMVIAREGRILVGSDYDQLELRILAALTGDKNLIRRCKYADNKRKLEPEWDPHSFVTAMALGNLFTDLDPYDPNHKQSGVCTCERCIRDAFRGGTKSMVYGSLYGAGPEKILEQTITNAVKAGQPPPPIDLITTKKTLATFDAVFPDTKRYRDESLAEARETGYLREMMFGKYRIFPMLDVPATEAANFGIQSFAASVIDWSSIMLLDRLREESPSTQIIAQVHDALYCELDDTPEEREIVGRLMTECMACEIRMRDDLEWMPLTASPEFNRVWSKCG